MAESKIGRSHDGIPQFDGSPELLPLYKEEALQYWMSFEYHKRYLAGPRLLKELSGVAKVAVRTQTLRDPQWLSHPKGVYQLLGFLEQTLSKPSLVEASRFVMKFFYNMGRRRGESMTSWVTRHAEALWEASQSLRKVQKEYTPEKFDSKKKTRDLWEDYSDSRTQSEHDTNQQPFRDDGRLAEDEEEEHAGSWYHDRRNSWYSGYGGWSDQSWKTQDYAPPEDWDTSEEIFIPEFLAGFLLLHRSGLDVNEKGNVLAAIRGEFSTKTVGRALREQWSDYDLAKRDRMKAGTALVAEQDDEDLEALMAEDEMDFDDKMDPDEREAYMLEQERAEAAYEAIQQQKATLKEARWKQRQIKLGRNFYPPKPFQRGGGGSTQPGQGSRGPIQCFKCKGPHKLADCPHRNKDARVAEEAAEIVFKAEIEEQYVGCATESALVAQEPGQMCMGIIDSGATASLGSVEALEHIMMSNIETKGDSGMSIDLEKKPVFKFGNGAKKQCLSTVKMQMEAGEKMGAMEIHVHDAPGQPVLVSRRALKALGAVLDFAENKIIYKNVDPKTVVDLHEAENGHLLMPLTGNLLEKGRARSVPFISLDAE